MQILVAIDDTDTVKMENVEVLGTGELASMIQNYIEERGWGKCQSITRHQLLIHPDIPYTSHNSSMCFAAEIDQIRLDEIIEFAAEFLQIESAPDSDPGLCVAVPERISQPGRLIAFGYLAKNYVLDKNDAYALAQNLGVHLSEHGGTGQGVIGALAGAGLRLSGNDGRFKGKVKIKSGNETVSVGHICAQGQVDYVKCLEQGLILPDHAMVRVGDHVKTILHYGQAVLPVLAVDNGPGSLTSWQTYSKSQMKEF